MSKTNKTTTKNNKRTFKEVTLNLLTRGLAFVTFIGVLIVFYEFMSQILFIVVENSSLAKDEDEQVQAILQLQLFSTFIAPTLVAFTFYLLSKFSFYNLYKSLFTKTGEQLNIGKRNAQKKVKSNGGRK